MRRVRCCYYGESDGITYGKEYDVISNIMVNNEPCVLINNDFGKDVKYVLSIITDVKVFEDITSEYRDEIINEILE